MEFWASISDCERRTSSLAYEQHKTMLTYLTYHKTELTYLQKTDVGGFSAFCHLKITAMSSNRGATRELEKME